MDAIKLSSMEADTIGEVLNISLGSAATAISTMLDTRVDITTPKVVMKHKDDFEFKELEPAIGVEIANEVGLTGSNILLLKKEDVRIIVGMLMGYETPSEEFELDEISSSAIGEVMNQMMGSSATALSELLERTVDISTPVVFPVESRQIFVDKYFGEYTEMVEAAFTLSIGDKVQSEFKYLLPYGLATELVEGFFKSMPDMENVMNPSQTPVAEPAPQPVPTPAPQPQVEVPVAQPVPVPTPQVAEQPVMQQPVMQQPVMQQPVMQQPVMQQPMMMAGPVVSDQLSNTLAQMMELMQKQMEMTQQQMQAMQAKPADPKKIRADAPPRPNFSQDGAIVSGDSNFDLVLGVPVEVAVEIGRTKKLVRDVLDLTKGSLVVLDKLAGEQVDLLVNGRCVAHGDVVVVDDSFGIRINEILTTEFSPEDFKE